MSQGYNGYGYGNSYGPVPNQYQPQPQTQPQATLNFAGNMARGYPNINYNQEVLQQEGYMNSTNKNSYQLGEDLESSSRNSFIKKVYTLLSIQLLMTTAICIGVMKSLELANFLRQTPVIIILSVLLIVMSFVISCCREVVQKFGLPILLVFTLLFSFLVGIICAQTQPQIVVMAAGLTALIVIGLTIFACVTKTDLTGLGPYLMVISLVLIVFGIVCIFWKNPIAQLIYACIAALLFSVYLLFDTQLVLGKFTNAYSLDDAYFAAIQLYIDIIEIFLQLIRILSYVNN